MHRITRHVCAPQLACAGDRIIQRRQLRHFHVELGSGVPEAHELLGHGISDGLRRSENYWNVVLI
jgi:hypothetical protein